MMFNIVKLAISALIGALVSCLTALITNTPVYLIILMSLTVGATITLVLYGVLGDSKRRKHIKQLSEDLEKVKRTNENLRKKLADADIPFGDGLDQFREKKSNIK